MEHQASPAGERPTRCAHCGAERYPGLPIDAATLVTMLEHALLAARRLLMASAGAPHHRPGVVRHGVPGRVLPTRDAPPDASSGNRGCLSRREAEVLRLLAAGHSNREIAHKLYLSPRTVQRHVANAYVKIGVHCRAQATAYALHHGLR